MSIVAVVVCDFGGGGVGWARGEREGRVFALVVRAEQWHRKGQ